MNFHYSATTTNRPHTTSSHFNEDARCDNEVNLILEKNHSKQLLEKATFSEQQKQQQPQQPPPPPPTSSSQPQPSVAVNQTEQYYFMPIREQSSTMALHTNNNNSIAADDTSIVSIDHEKPSKHDIFDCSKTTASHTSSFASAATNKGNNQYLKDTDLADLFASSMVSISRASTTADKNDITDNPNTLDDIFFQQVSELVCSSHHNALGPPPGFENFRFDTSSSSSASASLTTVSSISTAAAVQSKVTSSDITNFSQLLPSTNVDSQPSVLMAANACSSSSSHSSFTSDDQTIFFPMGAHPYSSSSQIFPLNTHHSTTTNSMNSNAKPFLPNSLSTNAKHFASLDKSGAISPKLATHADTDTLHKDGNETPSQVFPSPHSFFTNGHAEFVPAKPASNKTSSTSASTNRQSSSSASSSTSSSIDEALIQLTQQQQSQAQASTVNKFFSDDTLSIFNIPSAKPPASVDKQQLAMHDNINSLASMAAASTPATPESPWQQSAAHASTSAPAKRPSTRPSHQSIIPQSPSKSSSTNMQELMDSLNELCYRGFDELNALIQEQRWVQNYLNVNPSAFPTSSGSPLTNLNGTNCCSSRILIVPEYFIFKCKKVEVTASHVYDLLATGRPELRLRDLMFVFKSWRETIANAEHVHQDEEMKLRLNTEHFPSYYMNETILQAVFERVYLVTRQLVSMTQQARAAFQYATLNVFQVSSRQASQTSSNVSQSSNSMGVTQLQGISQAKSSSVHRLGSSMRTTP